MSSFSQKPVSAMEHENIAITVCGDGGCGKSSLTLRLVRSQFVSEYDPTIEDSYSVTRVVDGRTYNLHLTDTAGQEEYRGLFSTSNLHSDAFLLVYDITSVGTLSALTHFAELIAMESDERVDRGGVPPVKVLAGNKCDLGKIPGMRQIDAKTGLTWAREQGCGFMETSARDMVNVEETFQQIVRRVVDARRAHEQQNTRNPTQGHSIARTRALTPVDEKTNVPPSATAPRGEGGLRGFFRKLGCFS